MKLEHIFTIEGILLSLAGLTHIVYMLGFSTTPLTEPSAIGGTLFGVFYTFFGFNILCNKTNLLLITLIINTLGLSAVLMVGERSPLWEIDPYLIAVDLISIPTLIFLCIRKSDLEDKIKARTS